MELYDELSITVVCQQPTPSNCSGASDITRTLIAIGEKTSIFGYDPEAAGYPWDEDKTEVLRDRYDQLAQHVEGYQ